MEVALDRAALTELHFQLIERFSPPSVVVNAGYDIVHLSDNAGRFLKLVGGEPTFNLLRVIHPSLRTELRAAAVSGGRTKPHATTESCWQGCPVESRGRRFRGVTDIRVSAD